MTTAAARIMVAVDDSKLCFGWTKDTAELVKDIKDILKKSMGQLDFSPVKCHVDGATILLDGYCVFWRTKAACSQPVSLPLYLIVMCDLGALNEKARVSLPWPKNPTTGKHYTKHEVTQGVSLEYFAPVQCSNEYFLPSAKPMGTWIDKYTYAPQVAHSGPLTMPSYLSLESFQAIPAPYPGRYPGTYPGSYPGVADVGDDGPDEASCMSATSADVADVVRKVKFRLDTNCWMVTAEDKISIYRGTSPVPDGKHGDRNYSVTISNTLCPPSSTCDMQKSKSQFICTCEDQWSPDVATKASEGSGLLVVYGDRTATIRAITTSGIMSIHVTVPDPDTDTDTATVADTDSVADSVADKPHLTNQLTTFSELSNFGTRLFGDDGQKKAQKIYSGVRLASEVLLDEPEAVAQATSIIAQQAAQTLNSEYGGNWWPQLYLHIMAHLRSFSAKELRDRINRHILEGGSIQDFPYETTKAAIKFMVGIAPLDQYRSRYLESYEGDGDVPGPSTSGSTHVPGVHGVPLHRDAVTPPWVRAQITTDGGLDIKPLEAGASVDLNAKFHLSSIFQTVWKQMTGSMVKMQPQYKCSHAHMWNYWHVNLDGDTPSLGAGKIYPVSNVVAHIPTTTQKKSSNLLYHPSCIRQWEITRNHIAVELRQSLYQQYLKRKKVSPLTLTIDVAGTHKRFRPVYVACRSADTTEDHISAHIYKDGGIVDDDDCEGQQFQPLSSRRTVPRAVPRPVYCPYGEIKTRVLNKQK